MSDDSESLQQTMSVLPAHTVIKHGPVFFKCPVCATAYRPEIKTSSQICIYMGEGFWHFSAISLDHLCKCYNIVHVVSLCYTV